MRLKSILLSAFGSLGVVFVFYFIRLFYIDPFGDPDLFFHFKLSEIWALSGRPEALPAFDLVGWANFFTDKEFLFHWFTRWGWIWNQERGVILTALGFSFLTLFSLSYFSLRRVGYGLGLLCSVLVGLGSFHFLYRLAMVRPQTLAILLYSLILFAWVYRSFSAILFFTFLYTLAYHLVVVPLALFFFILVLDWNSKESRKLAIYGVLGVLIGFVLNPYFPGNILVSLQVLKIPFLISSGEKINFGSELWPHVSSIYFLGVIGILISVYFISRITQEHRVLCAQVLLLIAIRAFNPRAIEYLIPTFWILVVLSLERIRKLDRRLFYKSVAGFVVVMGASAWSSYREVPLKIVSKKPLFAEPIRRSLQPLIQGARSSDESLRPKDTRIFHCEWDQSPYVWYSGFKNTKLVDLLDPTFLLVHAPELYRLRQNIITGKEEDPVLPIVSVFDANWIFCRAGPLLDSLAKDPRVIRVPELETPHTGRSLRIDLTRNFHFVQNWTVSKEVHYSTAFLSKGVSALSAYGFPMKQWSKLSRPTGQELIEKNRVLFPLKSAFDSASDSASGSGSDPAPAPAPASFSASRSLDYRCVWLKPDSSWLKKNHGSDLLAWGVGGHIRVWRNGRALYKQEGSHDFTQLIDGFIPISPTLNASDEILILFCAVDTKTTHVAFSAWKRSELDQWCRDQNRGGEPSWARVKGWDYIGESRGNCYGAYALPIKN